MDAEPSAGEVNVWRIPASQAPTARAQSWLSAAERERARRFHRVQDRNRFLAVRAAARKVLGEKLGVRPERLEFVESSTGKPSVRSGVPPVIEFNVAHSGDLGLLAVSMAGPVGVDVESVVHAIRHVEAIEPFLGEDERRAVAVLPQRAKDRFLLESWVMREAMVKAMGVGLGGVDLRTIQRPRGSGLDAVRLQAPGALELERGWWLRWLDIGHDYVAAVVTAGRPKTLKVRDYAADDFPGVQEG